jgi:hypothetical protein
VIGEGDVDVKVVAAAAYLGGVDDILWISQGRLSAPDEQDQIASMFEAWWERIGKAVAEHARS